MMYGWWDYGASPPWYGMIFGPLTMIAFIVITVVIIKWVLRATGLGWQSDVRPRTPLDTLKDRFARGDIDRAEFEERKQLMSGS